SRGCQIVGTLFGDGPAGGTPSHGTGPPQNTQGVGSLWSRPRGYTATVRQGGSTAETRRGGRRGSTGSWTGPVGGRSRASRPGRPAAGWSPPRLRQRPVPSGNPRPSRTFPPGPDPLGNSFALPCNRPGGTRLVGKVAQCLTAIDTQTTTAA